MENNIDIIIFLKNGQTLRFQQIEGFYEQEEGWIGFVYQGVATGKERVAVFYLDHIAGYAIDSKGVEDEE
ncbi:hypothetical protein ABQE19_04060 [Enterococcus thailandicus]|uniref:hypothetical protein n=1 Tax=Enterococcus thailandicus TaxID=417368 RepID=UPI0032E3B56D